jgi:hypothetical protein
LLRNLGCVALVSMRSLLQERQPFVQAYGLVCLWSSLLLQTFGCAGALQLQGKLLELPPVP